MDKDTLNAETQEAMRKAVEYTLHEFSSVRTGKASPALVENIDVQVQSYGSTMKLKQLAVISSPEPRMLMILVLHTRLILHHLMPIKTTL